MNPNAPLNRPDAPEVAEGSPLLKRLSETDPVLLELEAWAEKHTSSTGPCVKWLLGNPHEDGLLLEERYYSGNELQVFDWNTKIEDIEHVRGIYEVKLTRDKKGYFRFAEKPVYVGLHSIEAHDAHMDILEPRIPQPAGEKPNLFRRLQRDHKKNFIGRAEVIVHLPEAISNMVRDYLHRELKVRFGAGPVIRRGTGMDVKFASETPQELQDTVKRLVVRVLEEAKPEYIGRAKKTVDTFLTGAYWELKQTDPRFANLTSAKGMIEEHDHNLGMGQTEKLPQVEEPPAEKQEPEL